MRFSIKDFFSKCDQICSFWYPLKTPEKKEKVGELEKKDKSQNKNKNRKMNQKDLSFFANSPKKTGMMIF